MKYRRLRGYEEEEIRSLYKKGVSLLEIQRMYNTSYYRVKRCVFPEYYEKGGATSTQSSGTRNKYHSCVKHKAEIIDKLRSYGVPKSFISELLGISEASVNYAIRKYGKRNRISKICLKSPEGKEIEFNGWGELCDFCVENYLSFRTMRDVVYGSKPKYKGWTLVRVVREKY